MLKQYTALSVVAPNAGRIVQGQKTLEVRSRHPEALPLKDVVIVENQNFLLQDGDEESGLAVALVDIEAVHAWRVDEVEAACASYWAEGYFAWLRMTVHSNNQSKSWLSENFICSSWASSHLSSPYLPHVCPQP